MLRHSSRQANSVADFLGKMGSQLTQSTPRINMLIPPDPVLPLLRADQQGMVTNRLVLRNTCSKLACLGKLSVISSMSDDITPNYMLVYIYIYISL